MAKKRKKSNSSKRATTKRKPEKLPSVLDLIKESFRFITTNIKLLSGVTAVYGLSYFLFIRAGSTLDVSGTEKIISNSLGSNTIVNKLVLTGTLISSGGKSTAGSGNLYQFLLFVIASLAFIWAIRYLTAGKKFKIRDAFYSGMYPFIPFIILIFIISLELIPFVVGGFLYSTAEMNKLISSSLERVFFITLWLVFSSISVYWLANSLIAIYAVTLPDTYPIQAMRSTKEVIKGRRWSVLSRIFALGLLVLIFGMLLIFAVVYTAPVLAVYMYDFVMITGLLFVNVYMFKLYRSLI